MTTATATISHMSCAGSRVVGSGINSLTQVPGSSNDCAHCTAWRKAQTVAAASTIPATIPEVWKNSGTPVVYRPDEKGNLMLRVPYREGGNRQFLKGEKTRRFEPIWDAEKKFWSVPKSWFTELVEAVVREFGCAYVIQPHHEHEKCSASCQNAHRLECECSCLGANHGRGGRSGHDVAIGGAKVMPWRDGKLAVQFFSKGGA